MTKAETDNRIRELRDEIARLRREQETPRTYYQIAKGRCKEYWDQMEKSGKGYGPYSVCMEVTRRAFREKSDGQKMQPSQYVESSEKADEFFRLFQKFIHVYMDYVTREDCGDD